MMTNQERFELFLTCAGKSEKTTNSYSGCLAGMVSDRINQFVEPIGNLYDITDIKRLKELLDAVLQVPEFNEQDKRGGNMYSAAFNMYISYLRFKQSLETNPPVKAIKATGGTESQLFPYLTAIRTKPFLILGGFSGTGKSQKVKELAYLTCPKELQGEKAPGNYALISVKPNWHDSTELLGYESTISKKYMVTDFMRFLVKAMHYEDEKVPFFCCMDEMNLAHVEEYFAEFLSVLESRKKDADGRIVSAPLVSANVFSKKYGDEGWNIFMDLGLSLTEGLGEDEVNAIPNENSRKNDEEFLFERQDIIDELKTKGLCIPSNLIVIGTVNMDDTTNSFSRKVIDRAMIFETDIERFDKDTYFGAEDALIYGNMDGEAFICDEVRADQAVGTPDFDLSEEERTEIINFINELNDAMVGTSFQVSYRVQNETILYYRAMKIVNGEKASLEQVKNDILMMKVLPRIEGDAAARKALTGLKKFVEKYAPKEWANIKSDMTISEIDALPATPWKDSLLKINYMLNLLNTGDGFTRFWK